MSTELPTTPTDLVDTPSAVEPLTEPALSTPEEGLAAMPAEEGTLPQGAARTPEMSSAACLALLQQHFPALFPAQGPYRPLKLRIQADIQARVPGVFTRKALSITLHRHTTSTAYLRGLVGATHRFDLDGQEAGELAEEHRAAAKTELDRRQALMAERRAAERAASRAGQGRPTGPMGADSDGGSPSAGAPVRRERSDRSNRSDQPRERRADARGPRASNRPQGPRREGASGAPGGRPDGQGRMRPPRDDRPRGDANPEAADTIARREQAPVPVFTDPAQRDRQNLLRAWETTGLTKRNFCTLKGLSEADFDAQIAQAQQERSSPR